MSEAGRASAASRRRRARRAGLERHAPPRTIHFDDELHEWRGRIMRMPGLTMRDRLIAQAHAFRVERYEEGTPRGHFASSRDIGKVAGLPDGADRSVRIANVKLQECGLIERVPGPTPRSTRYTYLLCLPSDDAR